MLMKHFLTYIICQHHLQKKTNGRYKVFDTEVGKEYAKNSTKTNAVKQRRLLYAMKKAGWITKKGDIVGCSAKVLYPVISGKDQSRRP